MHDTDYFISPALNGVNLILLLVIVGCIITAARRLLFIARFLRTKTT